MRGSVQRSHIWTKMRTQALPKTMPMPIRFATIPMTRVGGSPFQPPEAPWSQWSSGPIPVCQPPRKMQAAIAETTYIATYSARKKIEKRMPEYSVWNPATSSDSASGRSNGARFVSASDAVK